MKQECVLIAGAGVAGLSLALTLHQIGVPCVVLESVRELKPLGVGINLQPNSVRELEDLGIGEAEMDEVGIPAREWALVGLNGKDIYSEKRGKLAGYNWHQYAVHRGRFHLLLYRKVVERLGPDAVKLGHKVTGYPRRLMALSPGWSTRQTVRARSSLVRCWWVLREFTRKCARRCTRTSPIFTGVARSCGAAPRVACRSARALPSWALAPADTAW